MTRGATANKITKFNKNLGFTILLFQNIIAILYLFISSLLSLVVDTFVKVLRLWGFLSIDIVVQMNFQ